MNSRALPDLGSPAPAPSRRERRNTDRFVTIFRPGKITRDDDELLCLVRNIGKSGAMTQVEGGFEVGDAVTLEFALEEHIAAHVVWVRDHFIGLRFDTPIDLSLVLCAMPAHGPRPRAPRLKVPAAGHIEVGPNVMQVVTTDVSQSGAKIVTRADLKPGGEVHLCLDGLGKRLCVVRWSKEGVAGVSFVQPVAIWELSAWATEQRARATAHAPHPPARAPHSNDSAAPLPKHK